MMNHKYIEKIHNSQDLSEIRKLAAHVLNSYIGSEHSISKLKKLRTITFQWNQPKKGIQTGAISFDQLFDELKENFYIDTAKYNLPDLQSPMFDSSIELNLPQPLLSRDGKNEAVKIALPLNLGASPPLSPCIMKEGFAINNLLTYVLENVSDIRQNLIDQSHGAIALKSHWFLNFRMLLNECVSAVDMQLHQIYLVAEYRGSELKLNFDREKLGERFGRRIMDKFDWVGSISGKHLDDAEREKESFRKLKDLRNHLNHFDPPCFCCSVEELVEWLNLVPDVGRLIWKIRTKFKAQLNTQLIRLILQPKVQFCPLPGKETRPTNDDGTSGYVSSVWKI